jgi:hypothetical protein
MGLIFSNILAEAIRWITATIIAAVCLVFGFAPAETLAEWLGTPPSWVVHPWTRLAIILLGVIAIVIIFWWDRRSRRAAESISLLPSGRVPGGSSPIAASEPPERKIYTATERAQSIDGLVEFRDHVTELIEFWVRSTAGLKHSAEYLKRGVHSVTVPLIHQKTPEEHSAARKRRFLFLLNECEKKLMELKEKLDAASDVTLSIRKKYPRMIDEAKVLLNEPQRPNTDIIARYLRNIAQSKDPTGFTNPLGPSLLSDNELMMERLQQYQSALHQNRATMNAKISDLRNP